ncbi:m-phase inducer phosphatase [Xanthoria calcicola]
MEHSSPLAAMQPPSLPIGQWGCRNERQDMLGRHCGGQFTFGPSNFNFKDLSMNKAPIDYFSLKPVRGSSPTASLAADLSQNFHIDQSPQLPTPRRALFSSNLFGTLTGRECLTTPPPPSSSPGPGNDSMEISPLPHKAPYQITTQILRQSPTPEPTPSSDITMSCEESMQLPVTQVPSRPAYIERRRSSLLRPSLARAKGHSTTSVSLKTVKVDNPMAPFKFGGGPSVQSQNLGSLDECFAASPPQERRPQSANSPLATLMGPPKMRQPFSNLHTHTRTNGSPILGQVRKPSSNSQRPRKQFRRSLSMFEHPGDVMKEQQAEFSPAGGLDSIMDIDDNPQLQLQLPHFVADEESLPRITKETMIDVLNGKYEGPYDQSLIVDCRFEYEYEGGHIEGAINVNSKEELAKQLFEPATSSTTLLIFHCEYSAHRAPLMAKFLRHKDRAINAHRYPLLTYPEVYILDGGYSAFFQDHRFRCSPQNYVEMGAKEHASACERGLGRIKQQRGKLCRAQTFAFGQHQTLDDSPTACSRQVDSSLLGMDLSMDHAIDARRMLSRRMASY